MLYPCTATNTAESAPAAIPNPSALNRLDERLQAGCDSTASCAVFAPGPAGGSYNIAIGESDE